MTRGHAALFAHDVYARRLDALRRAAAAGGFDAVVLFAPESHYYFTGYDSGGYVFFQALVVPSDAGPLTLLTRRPDRDQARDTSVVDEIELWFDAEDADPAGRLRDVLRGYGLAGKSVGLELATYGLTGRNWEDVRTRLDGWCTVGDASDLARRIRLVKGPEEIVLIREAAALADAAAAAVRQAVAPGVLEGSLAARSLAAILEGGGDMPPAGPLVNSGRRAAYGRGVGGPRALADHDQVVLELAATRRRYNVCLERTFTTGSTSDRFRLFYDVAREALARMIEAARPGEPLGRIAEAHRHVVDAAGLEAHRFAACGYALGATYRPSWMDVPPMLYPGQSMRCVPGLVLFPHCMLGDAEAGIAVGLGDTLLVGDRGAEVLTTASLDHAAERDAR